jgi:hypothetical protein
LVPGDSGNNMPQTEPIGVCHRYFLPYCNWGTEQDVFPPHAIESAQGQAYLHSWAAI